MENNNLPHNHNEKMSSLLLKMPSLTCLEEITSLLQQIVDPTRLRILWLLSQCEECGINIASIMGMTPPAISHHLRILKLHGLIKSRREGKEVYYKLAECEKVTLVLSMMKSLLSFCCFTKEEEKVK